MPDMPIPGGGSVVGGGDSLTTEFHDAWQRFASECGPTLAPEATYQWSSSPWIVVTL